MHSRAGSQVPFSSINIGAKIGGLTEDEALVTQAFLEEYDKGLGHGEQPIFPNIIFRLKKGVNLEKDDPYRYLTDLAIKVAAKRMNPTFKFLDCSLDKPLIDQGITPAVMGCRTYIGANLHGDQGPVGRGNIAPISINLPRIGIESNKNWNKFFANLGKIMELCAEELMYRYDTLKRLKVKDLPFVAGQHLMKGSENLNPEDNIEPILKQGTWGIGFIGLAETMVAMTGHHHGEGNEYWEKAYEIAKFMRTKVDEFKARYNLNFTYYATPAEGLSGRFTYIDKKKYGIIPGVTDKDYYTNSYHIPVKYPIAAIDKIFLEAPFHKLCNAGHITYVELDGGSVEQRAVFINRMITIAANNTDISYLAFNFHIRNCKKCGTDVMEHESACPKCGSTEIQGISRVTGYMSLDERFSPGKVAERADRTKHTM
jgi:ribonucleoside-triphosphate reductase